MIQLRDNFVQYFMHFLNRNGFQQVFIYPQFNRLLGILELIMAAKDDNFHPWHTFTDDLAKLQAIHEWHLNIRDKDIWLDCLYQRQRHVAICRFARELETIAFPIDIVPDTFPGDDFVFYKKYFI